MAISQPSDLTAGAGLAPWSGARAGRPLLALPWRAYLPLAPAVVFLLLFLVLPLGATAWLSLSPNVLIKFEGIGLGNYAYLAGKPYYLAVVWRSLRLAGLTTVAVLLLGYPAAWILRELSE